MARRTLVMYALPGETRFGVIVSKAVGGAVVRNRVKRRLRHLAAGLVDDSRAVTVVVRALPAAGTAGAGLADDFAAAWRRCIGSVAAVAAPTGSTAAGSIAGSMALGATT